MEEGYDIFLELPEIYNFHDNNWLTTANRSTAHWKATTLQLQLPDI